MQMCSEEDYNTVVETLAFDDNLQNLGLELTSQPKESLKGSVNCVSFSQSGVYKSVRQLYSKVSLVHGLHRDQYYSQTYTSLYYSSVWSPNSYLLQCFQVLVHFQGISQHSGSLRSNFIVAKTV